MKKQDLLVSMTIEKHRIATRFLYLAQHGSIQDDHVMMGKDAKGKGKTRAKRVKGGNCSAEEKKRQEIDGQTKSLARVRQGFFLNLLDKTELFFSSLGRCFSFSLPKDLFLLLIFPQD